MGLLPRSVVIAKAEKRQKERKKEPCQGAVDKDGRLRLTLRRPG